MRDESACVGAEVVEEHIAFRGVAEARVTVTRTSEIGCQTLVNAIAAVVGDDSPERGHVPDDGLLVARCCRDSGDVAYQRNPSKGRPGKNVRLAIRIAPS